MRFAPGALALVALLLFPAAPRAQPVPTLTLSPASGVYADSQRMDLVILLRDTNGRGVTGGQVRLDGQDITEIAVTVFHPEPVAGGVAFRSINVPMGILGLGVHIFEVTLSLSDGSQTSAAAVWNVLRSQ
jgi:hypothetical protein